MWNISESRRHYRSHMQVVKHSYISLCLKNSQDHFEIPFVLTVALESSAEKQPPFRISRKSPEPDIWFS